MVGPGDLDRDLPRHDNDFVNFLQIQIAPTQEEVFSAEPPYLPRNNSTFLRDDRHMALQPEARRIVETHFRLMREDLLRPLCGSVQMLRSCGGILSPNLTSGRFRPSSKGKGHDSGAVDLYVYRNARVTDIRTSPRSGVCYEITFDQPGALRKKTTKELHEFWKASRRLQMGALVCLWRQSAVRGSEPAVEFAVIIERDDSNLAGEKGAKIVVTSAANSGYSERLIHISLKIAANEGRNVVVNDEVLLLEPIGSSYFAYAPVLSALQSLARVELPFAEILCADQPIAASKPAIFHPGIAFDFNVLANPTRQSGLLKNVRSFLAMHRIPVIISRHHPL